MKSFGFFICFFISILYVATQKRASAPNISEALKATLDVFPEKDYAPTLLDGLNTPQNFLAIEDSLESTVTNVSQIKNALSSSNSSTTSIETEETVEQIVPLKAGFKPLNQTWVKNPGMMVKDLNENELRTLMVEDYGFKNLHQKNLYELRRIWLAYMYDKFFWDVHDITGFPVSVVYAYFIMEATSKGIESDLMANYMNPGGVKYHGKGKKAKAFDDCYDSKGNKIKCDFAVYSTYEDMVKGWSSILNAKRYVKCKSESTASNICRCLFKSGYHTGNNWANRADLSKGYWQIRKSFPSL